MLVIPRDILVIRCNISIIPDHMWYVGHCWRHTGHFLWYIGHSLWFVIYRSSLEIQWTFLAIYRYFFIMCDISVIPVDIMGFLVNSVWQVNQFNAWWSRPHWSAIVSPCNRARMLAFRTSCRTPNVPVSSYVFAVRFRDVDSDLHRIKSQHIYSTDSGRTSTHSTVPHRTL